MKLVPLSSKERHRIAKEVDQKTRHLHGTIHNLEATIKMEQNRAEQLKKNVDAAASRDAERLATIAKKDEALAVEKQKIADLVAERDRIVRLVDQFTSISIVPHGAVVGCANVNLPKELRKT